VRQALLAAASLTALASLSVQQHTDLFGGNIDITSFGEQNTHGKQCAVHL
jgi:hypothetical protein